MSHHTCSRREFLAAAALSLLAACEPPPRTPPLPDWMLTPDATDPELWHDALIIQDLLERHGEIHREVEHYSYGIRATTTSSAPDLAERIRVHVEQMQSRLRRGAAIRQGDPLFAAVFAHHSQVELRVERLADGVRVTETSPDPAVVALLRQHAVRAVSEFVADGVERARRTTPCPPGYPC
ncbi:hypothetical protein ABT324_32000 [Saccharopolyspora sp. NPDC000359]|uniref:hypothetical protein n=1 Tax=Saccharopolyspora sp. NPDC000359 TaxID=3154251 RepID=UPI00331A4C02